MFSLMILISAVTIIAKCAEMEGRSSFAWGGITLVVCICSSAIIPLPFINVVIGFIVSFIALFAVKVIGQQSAG